MAAACLCCEIHGRGSSAAPLQASNGARTRPRGPVLVLTAAHGHGGRRASLQAGKFTVHPLQIVEFCVCVECCSPASSSNPPLEEGAVEFDLQLVMAWICFTACDGLESS